MKIQRPGNTESHLIFNNFLKINHPSYYSIDREHLFIDWLYRTSGLYDKSVRVEDKESILQSHVYNKWLTDYENSLLDCTHLEFHIGNPTFQDDLPPKFMEFVSKFSAPSVGVNSKVITSTDEGWFGYWHVENVSNGVYYGVFNRHYDILNNKKVLIVSPFAALVKYQYQHAVNKIFRFFPQMDLKLYVPPYTFINNGPHDNFFVTLEMICYEISHIDFDIALLSCGTYAAFLTEFIHSQLQKDAIYMGRGGNRMFGIGVAIRSPEVEYSSPYWITDIPKCLIYENANLIEDGVYWFPK